jgi:hypothetical protein
VLQDIGSQSSRRPDLLDCREVEGQIC